MKISPSGLPRCILTYTVCLGLWLSGVFSNLVKDKLARLCPFSPFCSIEYHLGYGLQFDYIPFGNECFCDEIRHDDKDGCYSNYTIVTIPTDNSGFLPCLVPVNQNAYIFSVIRPNQTGLPEHRMINSCPGDYADKDVVDKCNGTDLNPASYDDILVVSDSSNNIFQNKYCAQCHGATDLIRWGLETVSCKDSFAELRFSSSEIQTYFLQNCVLASVPPVNRTYKTRMTFCVTNVTSTCSEQDYLNDLFRGCHQKHNDTPFMVQFSGVLAKVYKNVIEEENGTKIQGPDICWGASRGKYLVSASVLSLIDLRAGSRESPRTSVCSESEIFDYATNDCRVLHCPPFQSVVFGRCQPIFEFHSSFFIFYISYKPEEKIVVQGSISEYNDSLTLYYESNLNKLYVTGCEFGFVSVKAVVDIFTNELTSVEAAFVLQVTVNCTLNFFGDVVRTWTNISESWRINDKSVNTLGKISFFKGQTSRNLEHYVYVLMTNTQNLQTGPKYFFLCPYVVFTVTEYKSMLLKIVQFDLNFTVDDFSDATETPSGFYVLSNDEIAVCLDTYLQIYGTAASELSQFSCSIRLLASLVVSICFIIKLVISNQPYSSSDYLVS